jgi:hypothetical protein
MSWLSNFKAKRADKKATKKYNFLHAAWQEDYEHVQKLITAFTNASEGKDSIDNHLMQKAGEHTLWSATAIFHETGRQPSQYVGGSSGVSIPVAGGIRFRVGAMRGQVVPGAEVQQDKDEGWVLLTTERLIFTGALKTQEWNFDKLLGLSTTPDESDYFISVSNRQKTSGIRFDPKTGREFNRFLGGATEAHEKGIDVVLDYLHGLEKDVKKLEPQLQLPSASAAIEAPEISADPQ